MLLCGDPAAERVFGPTSQGKSKETKYARWPLPANTVNKTSHFLIASDTSKNDRNYATYFGPVPYSKVPRPGKSHRLLLSSRRFCAVESCIVLCCGWDRPDGKQQLSTHQSCAFIMFLAETFS